MEHYGDRKTVRKYLKEAPREYERKPKSWKADPWRPYLRERWEQGVHNASRLFLEIRKRLRWLPDAGKKGGACVAK